MVLSFSLIFHGDQPWSSLPRHGLISDDIDLALLLSGRIEAIASTRMKTSFDRKVKIVVSNIAVHHFSICLRVTLALSLSLSLSLCIQYVYNMYRCIYYIYNMYIYILYYIIYKWRTKLLSTRNGHGQSGWSPIGCEGFHTKLNIPRPVPTYFSLPLILSVTHIIYIYIYICMVVYPLTSLFFGWLTPIINMKNPINHLVGGFNNLEKY